VADVVQNNIVSVHFSNLKLLESDVMYRKSPVMLVVFALLLGLTACGIGRDEKERMDVVTGFYLLSYVSNQVGGDLLDVTTLASKGAQPHDMRLSLKQRIRVADADLVEYLKGLQPSLDKAVIDHNKDRGFDAAGVEPLLDGNTPVEGANADNDPLAQDSRGKDPHVWLSPIRMADLVKAVAKRFDEIEPTEVARFDKAAAKLRGRLQAFDQEIGTALSNCASRTFVVSHNSFGYFAERYNLKQIAIRGLSPTEAPSAERLAEVSRLAKQSHVKTVFVENPGNPQEAQTVASQVGATTAKLDPLETAPAKGDYFSVMRANVAALRTALQCR
jgi:zinc transport system substrate-binding protein